MSSQDKNKKRYAIKLSIRTKLLASFLLISIVSFITVSVIGILNLNILGGLASDTITSLGNTSSRDSISALEETGEATIKQKALDVAGKVNLYLASKPGRPYEQIISDPELNKIAVEPVGTTGYTCLYEKGTGIMRFHPNPSMVGYDMTKLKDKLPSWWMVFQPSLRGTVYSGYYDWQDTDGKIRSKFMYEVPVEGTLFMVAATTYIDEFSQPAVTTEKKINTATAQSTAQINDQMRRTQITFISLFVFLVLVVLVLAFWLSRMITNPIKQLKEGSEIIGSGNLNHVINVGTGDEIEDLAHSFNKMAADIKTHVETIRRTTAENERVQKELEIARGIQQSFLPEAPPQIKGFDLAGLNTPALQVGGDFFDFIPVSLDKWGLVIADVSGKGFSAALFMALSRTMLRANAIGDPTVTQTITRANNMIAEEGRANMFVTLFYGVLDPRNKTLTYVNAGHNPPFVLGTKNGDLVMLAAKGIALGIMSDMEFEQKEIILREGDILILYTDGVTETINRQGEMFGQDRLSGLVENNRHLSASDLIKKIEKTVVDFSEGQAQFDDLTLLAVKVEEKVQ
jgi:serine phosphatase RsbU (regulator of sigma subunit)